APTPFVPTPVEAPPVAPFVPPVLDPVSIGTPGPIVQETAEAATTQFMEEAAVREAEQEAILAAGVTPPSAPGDLFNIIAYDSAVESFRPELQRFDDKSRASGIGFVEGIHAGGSTNIDEALRVAMEQLKDNDQPTYIIFLTDGLPTAGETSEAKIVANARAGNKVRARMFNFGVGYDVNSRLLDKLSRANFGKSEYVRPDENIEAHVSRLYNRIGSPVLTGVTIDYAFDSIKTEDGRPIDRTYPKENYDLFEGEQLVVVGLSLFRPVGELLPTVVPAAFVRRQVGHHGGQGRTHGTHRRGDRPAAGGGGLRRRLVNEPLQRHIDEPLFALRPRGDGVFDDLLFGHELGQIVQTQR
ncbi:MAG: VWA domain-containing protein, partial [Planctomycetes bacterium]|nr:VWA domain-containing protein [Planctomycetota bacterium]